MKIGSIMTKTHKDMKRYVEIDRYNGKLNKSGERAEREVIKKNIII